MFSFSAQMHCFSLLILSIAAFQCQGLDSGGIFIGRCCLTCERWLLFSHLPSPLSTFFTVSVFHRKIFTLHSLCNTLPFPGFLIHTRFCTDIQTFMTSEWLVSVIIKAIIILGIVRVFHKTAFIAAKTISWDLNHFCKSLFVMNGMIMLRHDALSECKSGKTTTNYSSHNCSYQRLLHAVLTRGVGTKKVTRSYTPEHC